MRRSIATTILKTLEIGFNIKGNRLAIAAYLNCALHKNSHANRRTDIRHI